MRTTQAFGAAATRYDQAAQVQSAVANDLIAFWKDEVGHAPKSICELGCGTGLLTQDLYKNFPDAKLLATDGSTQMLQVAKTKLPTDPRLRFDRLTIEPTMTLPQPFDTVIANMTFQWLANLKGVLLALRPFSQKIFFSTVLDGTFKNWLDAHHEQGVQSGIRRFLSMKTLTSQCSHIGQSISIKEAQRYVYYSDPLDFARNLRATGAHTPRPAHFPVNLRRIFRKFPAGIEINYRIATVCIHC